MRAARVLGLSGLVALICIFVACGGSSPKPPAPAGPPVITTTQLIPATVNVYYTVYIQASGGTGNYTWAMTGGTLPPGMTFNNSQLSGIPTASGSYQFTVQVTDAAGKTGSKQLTLTVIGAIVVTCNSCTTNPMTLPYGALGVPYSATLSASGGTAPYTWSIASGSSLPAGLTIDPTSGTISGTPTATQAPTQFTVQVTDSESPISKATAQFTLTIIGVTTSSLPNANINTPYSQGVTVGGGQAPFTWTITAGQLPAGLSLAAGSCTNSRTSTCNITGTPTTLGTSQFTLQVTDAENPPAVATAQLSIDVQAPTLQILTTFLPSGIATVPYSVVLQSAGGNPPLTWSILSGNLPTGLSLNPTTGVISGTPTTAGPSSFIVQVQDNENPPQIVQSGTLGITVNPALSNAALSGNYVFTFSGYCTSSTAPCNSTGTPKPVIMAGAFYADGNGHIVPNPNIAGSPAGELDLNSGSGEPNTGCSNSGPLPQTVQSGSIYSISANGLGTMTIVTNSATYNFHLAIRSDGSGSIIQDNPSGTGQWGSGTIKPQKTGTLAGIQGPFVLGITGADSSLSPYAAAGVVTVVNGQGDLGSGKLDVDDNGTPSPHTFLGTLSTTLDSLGRGCFANLTFDGNPSPIFVYAYYIVSNNQLVIVSTDAVSAPANLTLWSASRQINGFTGFTNANLAKPTLVELSANNSGASSVTAGIFTGTNDGAGSCQNSTFDAASFTFDQNQGGTLSQNSCSAQYCVDQTTGRVTLQNVTGSSCPATWQTTPPVFYLGGTNLGYAVGTDAAVSAGNVETQSGANFSAASISSDYWGGTVAPPASADTGSVTFLFADGVSAMTGTQYTSGSVGDGGPTNLALTYTLDSTGRGVVTDTSTGNTYGILYVVSLASSQAQSKFILLPAATDPALNVFFGPPIAQ